MKNIFAKVRQPALRYGLIFGLILEAIQILFLGILGNSLPMILGQIITIVILVLFVVFGYIAGLRASRETGKWSTGLLAGLLTGIFGFILFGIISLIFDAVFLQQFVNYMVTHPAPGANPSDYTSAFVLTGFIKNLFGGLLLYTAISVIGGVIGGLIGRNRASSGNSSYEEAMFIPPTPGMD